MAVAAQKAQNTAPWDFLAKPYALSMQSSQERGSTRRAEIFSGDFAFT